MSGYADRGPDLGAGLSVVVPVCNSALILPDLIQRLEPVLASLALPSEVILINDGSQDRSWEVIRELAARHARVRGINLMHNYGQHCALLCGIRAAKYGITVTMDDDLQHPPEEIPKLLAKLTEGYEVMYGTPEKQQHGFWRDRASHVTKLALQGVMGAGIARDVSGFRAFQTHVRDAFGGYRNAFVCIDVLLTWGTRRFTAIPVRHDPRRTGVSNYTFRKLATHAFNIMASSSTWPLQLATLVGSGLVLIGVIALIFVIGRCMIQGGTVSSIPLLASVTTIFSGVQLLAIGIVGEYLARMYFQIVARPPYMVRECFPGEDQDQGHVRPKDEGDKGG